MLTFQHIANLLALLAIPVLIGLVANLLAWKRKVRLAMGDPQLISQITRYHSTKKFLLKCSLAIGALALIILALANPQQRGKAETIQRRGVDVMVLLDVSKSMLAEDIRPSRLEKSKQLLNSLLDRLTEDRLGLILFAGRAYMQMPLTIDQRAARMYIQNAGPDAVPTQGTVIAEALRMANTAFNNQEHKYKSILLVTDGEDHDPDALQTAKQLADDGVMINCVGVGSAEGTTIIDPVTHETKKDENGEVVISKLNESELVGLANITNGTYIHLDNVEDAAITLSGRLQSMEQRTFPDAEFTNFKSYFQWLLAAALILLIAEFLLSERKGRLAEEKAKALVFIGILCICSSPLAAQSENMHIARGNRLYRENKLDQSKQQYLQALQQAPGNPAAAYNLGNAEYKGKEFDEAEKSYTMAIEHSTDSVVREKGFYNRGVAQIRGNKLDESIESWKNALKLDPGDGLARENLQKALMEKNKKQPPPPPPDKAQPKKKQQQDQTPKASKLSKQQVEQLLKALEEKEKNVQEKMNENRVKSLTQPEKDW